MNSAAQWLNELNKALRADPKKSGLLALLLLLLVVLVWRTAFSGGKPSPASAKSAASSIAGPTLPGASSPKQTAARPAGVSAAMAQWAEAPVPPVSRNLFAVRIDYFPVDGSRTTPQGSSEEGFWARLEKSLMLQADQRDKRENLIANFRSQAAKLRLESTIMGPQPMAMVNGQLVAEGSVVASFRVEKIETRRIIVEREGIRLEIQMK